MNHYTHHTTFLKQFTVPLFLGIATAALCQNGPVDTPTMKQWGVFVSACIYPFYIIVTLLFIILRARQAKIVTMRWWPLDVVVSSFLIVQILKVTLNMPRPKGISGAGFPSGHTTFSFALAWLMMETYPKLSVVWFALAGIVAWSRIERLDHYPYQINAGLLLGAAIGWSVTHLRQGILFPRLTAMRSRTAKAID